MSIKLFTEEEVNLFSCEKYKIIKTTITKYKLKNMIIYFTL